MAYIPNPKDATQPTEDKFVESAATEFRFLKGRVNALEISGLPPPEPVKLVTKRESQTMSAGQTDVFFTSLSYAMGTNALWITVDGLAMSPTDYIEIAASIIKFVTPFIGGEELVVTVGGLIASSSGKFSLWDTLGEAQEPTGASFYFRRDANYSGGTPGYVNAGIRVDTFVQNAASTSFEWGFVSVLHNYATGGENVAGYFQGNKYAGAGPTWGAVIEVWERTATTNPTTGTVALEIDVNCAGTDRFNIGARVGVDLAIRRPPGVASPPAEVAWGFRIQGDTGAHVGRGYSFYPGLIVEKGFDTSPATILSAAYMMAENQGIAFNAPGTRQITHNGAGWNFINPPASVTFWGLNDDGSLTAHGIQLLGARQTGWVMPTGPMSRATFDTSTVTLPELAARVAQFLFDIENHGLIGV